MNLHVVERSDSLTHVALEGELDIEGVNAVQDAFYFNLTSRRKPSIVDLAAVRFIASLGIGMLVRVQHSLRRNGVSMVLLNPQGMVGETLRTASIDELIPIVASREEALERLR